jgi:D-alanyl-D-alanine carboxypeptidase/D-alanyl-D-alanine-endopeptidase (penicillin-binding protein 4)
VTAIGRGRRLISATVAIGLLAACTTSATTPTLVHSPTSGAAATPSSPSSHTTSPTATPSIPLDLREGAWTGAIRDAIGDLPVSVAVGTGDGIVLLEGPASDRPLASVQKLITSMTALDAFGPGHRFATVAEAADAPDGETLRGDLWLVGSGDPDGGPARVEDLASALVAGGVRRIDGRIVGDTSAFTHEWWAPGWLPGVSRRYVRPATALAWQGNIVHDPELAAAAGLTTALEARGVRVTGSPSTGPAPEGLYRLATARSAPLAALLARQNHASWNFAAEMLAKALGADATGGRGRTADGAATIEAWAATRGVEITSRDGSGLSHDDRASARDLVTLLLLARDEPWFGAFEASLPREGQGTLEGRLTDVDVRAKTGTLFVEVVSALAGYVETGAGPAVFAIVSSGVPIATAKAIEDRIVRILAASTLD